MATYQSVQTTTFASASSVIVSKPVSLAIGDTMIAQVTHASTSGIPSSFTIPSGWDSLANVVSTGSISDKVRTQVLFKNADSADVAASNFTFSLSSGSGFVAGAIARLTDCGIVSGSATKIQDDAVTSPITFTGFTPTRSNNLLMMFAATYGTAGSIGSFSGYGVTTSNPTWTERYDLNNGTNRSAMALATASRPENTATGTVTISAVIPNDGDTVVVLIALSDKVNGSVTPTTEINAYAFTGIQSVKINAITEDASFSDSYPTIWTNETKPTTIWTNETL